MIHVLAITEDQMHDVNVTGRSMEQEKEGLIKFWGQIDEGIGGAAPLKIIRGLRHGDTDELVWKTCCLWMRRAVLDALDKDTIKFISDHYADGHSVTRKEIEEGTEVFAALLHMKRVIKQAQRKRELAIMNEDRDRYGRPYDRRGPADYEEMERQAQFARDSQNHSR